MDITAIVVAAIGALAILFPAYWSRKAASQTKPVNGQSISEQVDQLHRLFITHDEADGIAFRTLGDRDGELAEKIREAHDYSRDRWHKDDGRYAITLAILSTLADDTLPTELKAQRFQALYETAEKQGRWDGGERRSTEGEP